jgi:hypothetical protein
MYRLWLIQRGTFKNVAKDEITGIDSLLNFHYMGSAEFEWGALPQSLRRIIEANQGLYDFVEIESIKDKESNTARVYCKREETSDAIESVKHLSKNDYGYKEFAGMNKYIKEGIENSYRVCNFWWDVENDFFVVFGDEKQELLQTAIYKMEEKWDVKPKPKKKGLFKK